MLVQALGYGYCLAYLLALISWPGAAYPASSYRDLDICNHWNGRRHFLELGERGELHARNVSTTAYRSTPLSQQGDSLAADVWYQCNLELVTCAECVIRVTFLHANFSKSCSNTGGKSILCPCEHIQFSEPPYDTTISGQEFCGDGKVFRSKTRTLQLKFFYRATNAHVFSLQYFSERNVKIVSGSPRQMIVGTGNAKYQPQVISTPYFPMNYPRDYGIEHILTCEADNCQVRLDFTDFQLGLASTLEIFDSNGQMLDSYTGEHFRPPITVSSGKSLLLQFRGNAATGVGFRAEVSFVSAKQLKDERLVPYTDCGGMVTGPGGAITMMNMIENATDVRLFDCIWIIRPGNNYMMMKTHISLRVEDFYGMAARSELSIKQGTTSEGLEIEHVMWPNNGLSKESHIAPILTGYYIRLRGVFGMPSKLAIVYSVFNYLNCYIGSEFLCSNNHCISIRLHCDGFDHCGDGSDEPDSCEEDWAHLHHDRRWYNHKPNYYFPKIDQYPDLKTATGIFIISTLGIFGVLSGWMIILYRMGVRARHQRELQSHLQTISELLDRQEEERTPDEPPSYEAPPDYEEVIKVGMQQELREPKRQRRLGRLVCQRAPSSCTLQSTVEQDTTGAAAEEQPSTSAAALRNGGEETLATRLLMASAICGKFGVTPAPALTLLIDSTESHLQALQARLARQRRGGCAGGGTSTTPNSAADDCTDAFRDHSLNISLTLGMPSSNASQSLASNCTEHTYLKRARRPLAPRLRHTFSSPEAFCAPELQLPYPDFLSYGTNLPHERSSSNFGSELSRDPSNYSMGKRARITPTESPTLTDSDAPTLQSQLTLSQQQLLSAYSDSEAEEQQVSCFGRRLRRSRSFNSGGGSAARRRQQHQRSSSADLLIYPSLQRRLDHAGEGQLQRLFFI
ncbi:CG17352 [Drosophila busckii]|uniref:CG17352 n=1 Tax=Drosophila busckii TaxID=30019 RepID=A0A0M4EH59_DROBS|nr:CG17352 [Drosophila busckii]